MTKSDLITWIATLPETSPDLARVEAIRTGEVNNPANDGKALTISEAAARSGMSRPTIYRSLLAGSLHSFYPYTGSRPRITEGELARWLASRSTAA